MFWIVLDSMKVNYQLLGCQGNPRLGGVPQRGWISQKDSGGFGHMDSTCRLKLQTHPTVLGFFWYFLFPIPCSREKTQTKVCEKSIWPVLIHFIFFHPDHPGDFVRLHAMGLGRQSTYGFQKLACEYFAKGAWEQHQRLGMTWHWSQPPTCGEK